MSNKGFIELPSKDVWSAMKEIKRSDIRHLKVSIGEDTTILDSPIAFNLRIIPRAYTAPLQAVGLVASLFARITNTRITLGLNNDKD